MLVIAFTFSLYVSTFSNNNLLFFITVILTGKVMIQIVIYSSDKMSRPVIELRILDLEWQYTLPIVLPDTTEFRHNSIG